MSSVMEGHGIIYLHLLSVVIPSTLLAVLVMSFLVTMLFNSKLADDPIYRKRLEEGLVELRGEKQIEIKSGAKTSVWLFLPVSYTHLDVYKRQVLQAVNTVESTRTEKIAAIVFFTITSSF